MPKCNLCGHDERLHRVNGIEGRFLAPLCSRCIRNIIGHVFGPWGVLEADQVLFALEEKTKKATPTFRNLPRYPGTQKDEDGTPLAGIRKPSKPKKD